MWQQKWNRIVDYENVETIDVRLLSETIVVFKMFHDILNVTMKNIAQFVDCIGLYVFILPQSV